ncbi:MAG TPA: hypothetical protein VM283_01750 [Armatimonadota bacterium]|nr:hypothetical protein [Armatimonadota bacterium]
MLLMTGSVAHAQFRLASPEPLQITVGEVPLVIGRRLVPELEGAPEVREPAVEGWASVVHLWQADATSRARQEIAVRPDRVEFTHSRLIKPNVSGSMLTGLVIPLELLDGVRAEFIGTARPAGSAQANGRVLSGTLGEGGVTAITFLELARLHLPSGAVDVDCQPRGVWTGSYGVCKAAPRSSLTRTDDGWVLVATDGKARLGTLLEGKVVITPAWALPVGDVHPVVSTRWTDPYYPSVQVSIGLTPVPKYETCPIAEPGEDAAAWWDRPEALRPERDERFADVAPQRVEGAAPVDPTATAALHIRAEREGRYLVSLLVGAPDRPVGPCRASGGQGEPVQMPAVAAGEYGSWPVIGRSADGVVTVQLTGDFRLVAVALAPLMWDNEDYLFDRSWWVSEDFSPADDLPL